MSTESPTPEEIRGARERLQGHADAHAAVQRDAGAPRSYGLLQADFDDIRILLAATETLARVKENE